MNNTITLTDEQMKALQSGQSITIEPPKQVTRWEPKGGEYRLTNEFNIYESSVNNHITRNQGLQYQTRTQAEQAAKALRSYARQLSWLHENDDGWVADWDNVIEKYYIYYSHKGSNYLTSYDVVCTSSGIIYMSKDNAEKLAQLLNDGIVEF